MMAHPCPNEVTSSYRWGESPTRARSSYLLMETAGRERLTTAPRANPTSPQHRRNHGPLPAAEQALMASACSSLPRTLQQGRTLMDTTPLGLFATKARASNRLLYGDLRRLQRDVLPTGAQSREEVEALLSLDWIERVDKDWPGYLAKVVTDFVLSTSDPPGDAVDAEMAAWLVALLAHL